MSKSHAAGRGSEQPTHAQLAELHRQIEAGRVTKDRMQEFLRGVSTALSQGEAKEIVGARYFSGHREFLGVFGPKASFREVPPIPWTAEELQSPGLAQQHFLFLGNDELAKAPLSLVTLHKAFPGPNHPKLYLEWYLGQQQKFAYKVCGLRWYLMSVGPVAGSVGLRWDTQKAILPAQYEVPIATERVLANVLFYSLNREYLDKDFWVRTDDESAVGLRVLVRGWFDRGIYVDDWGDNPHDYIGVAASRKS